MYIDVCDRLYTSSVSKHAESTAYRNKNTMEKYCLHGEPYFTLGKFSYSWNVRWALCVHSSVVLIRVHYVD